MGDENQGIITVEYECPHCFLLWKEETKVRGVSNVFIVEKCEVCQRCELTSRQLLDRQVDILDYISLQRLPEVIRNLYNHMQLKPLDE